MSPDDYLGLGISRDDLTIGRFIKQVGHRYGQREALVFEGRRLSYRQLADNVQSAARAFLGAGVTKGSKVALLIGNRPEFVIAAHAVAAIGGVIVPVSTFASASERDYIIGHSDASLLIVQQRLANHEFHRELMDKHPELAEDPARSSTFPHLRRVVCLGEQWDAFLTAGDPIDEEVFHAAVASVHPSDDGLIIYTSGTTALPKAVLHANRAAVVQAWRWADQLRLSPEDRVWSSFPFFWTAGLSMVLGGTLAAGACLVMQEVFDAGKALELFEREKVTTEYSWPHIDKQLTGHPDIGKRDLSSLRRCGNALRPFAPDADDTWGTEAAYGLTETFTINTCLPADSPAELRASTHGVALPGMEIRVVDGQSGEALRTGDIGEIAVRGVTLMKNYYKTFPDDVFDSDGFFHTGDSGSLDESGYLHWAGRLSGLIKTAGANVSPVELEQKLADWGRLKVATVVGVPHPVLDEAVVLCAVRRDNDAVTREEIIAHLRSVVASYKVPHRVMYLEYSEMPYTGSQKVHPVELRSMVIDRLAADDPDEQWRSHLRELAVEA